jgi:hypothetical protein
VNPPSARAMSAATEGFSAMMSFRVMGCERPQRIPAKIAPFQPIPVSYARARARTAPSTGPARPAGRTQLLRDQLARRGLLVPQNHEND